MKTLKAFGNKMDRVPNMAFRMMSAVFWLRDRLISVDSLLDEFHIQKGQTVIDYGCGPGSYIQKASELVGETGHVHGVDIHELAICAIQKRISKGRIKNVTAHLAIKETCPLESDIADIIYALDMFHMVSKPSLFLKELHRLLKSTGTLFIDEGHQKRDEAKGKIERAGCFEMLKESKRYMVYRPVQ